MIKAFIMVMRSGQAGLAILSLQPRFLHHYFLEANDLPALQYNFMKICRTESCKRQHQVVNVRLGGREFGIGNFC